MLFRLVLGLVVAALAVDEPKGAPKKDAARAEPQTRLTKENVEKVHQGMSEADLVAIFGKPDEVGESVGYPALTWEDANRIHVVFEDGKATKLEGKFSARVKSRSVNEANFRKLRKGMTSEDVEAILKGAPNRRREQDGRVDRRRYENANRLIVQFDGGKVVGIEHSWSGTED